MALNINLAIVKVLILAQSYGLVLSFTCPNEAKLLPCRCYPISGQIRCDGATGLNESTLESISQVLTDHYPYLYIHNTDITIIKSGFKNVTFENIFIANNEKLLTIDPAAFKESSVTKVLEIRQNIALSESGLLDLAKKLGKNLTTIGFDENNFSTLDKLTSSNESAQLTFDGTSFPQLESLNLQNQTNQAKNNLTLKAKFINNLPNLTQLNLEKIGIGIIENDAIILNSTSPKNPLKHISIFLNNNKLTGDQLSSKIILPTAPNVTVGLDLQYNDKLTMTKENVQLWKTIAEKGGDVYINGISTTDCICNNTYLLADPKVLHHIHITPEPNCKITNSTEKLSQCKNNT